MSFYDKMLKLFLLLTYLIQLHYTQQNLTYEVCDSNM